MSPALPVALSCGEPAGVGPELALRAWEALRDRVPFFLIGDAGHLGQGAPHVRIADPGEAPAAMARGLPVLHRDFGPPVTPGQPQAAHAQPVIDAIAEGVALVMAGRARALCTAPIHKQALAEGAGFAYPGHTEYLAALAGVRRVVMMLAAPALRVVPVTIHMALAEVTGALTPALLEETLRITHDGLRRRFGLSAPRIAVAGLNPHAGEGGHLGREELDVIIPTLEQLRTQGMALTGPLPADTAFQPHLLEQHDAVLAMYHDQGLPVLKYAGFGEAINITLGLPFIRTSADHGTAFDLAGSGTASASSLIAATRQALALASAQCDA